MNCYSIFYTVTLTFLFAAGLFSDARSIEPAVQNQKTDSTKFHDITLVHSKYTLSDYNDSLSSLSSIIIYHPAKIEGDYFYEVYINDTIVYDAVWGTADTIKIHSGDKASIRGKSVTEDVLYFIPAKGKKYFIRCGLQKGMIRGKPLLEFVEPAIAEKELSKIKK